MPSNGIKNRHNALISESSKGFEINQGKAGIAAANIGDQSWSWDAVFRHSHSLVTRFSIGARLDTKGRGRQEVEMTRNG